MLRPYRKINKCRNFEGIPGSSSTSGLDCRRRTKCQRNCMSVSMLREPQISHKRNYPTVRALN